jgi:hypothetical protein
MGQIIDVNGRPLDPGRVPRAYSSEHPPFKVAEVGGRVLLEVHCPPGQVFYQPPNALRLAEGIRAAAELALGGRKVNTLPLWLLPLLLRIRDYVSEQSDYWQEDDVGGREILSEIEELLREPTR